MPCGQQKAAGMNGIWAWVYEKLLAMLTQPAGGVGTIQELGSGYSVEGEEMEQRTKIVAFCRAQLGKKYHLGVEVAPGRASDEWDCSEMVEAAYRDAGLSIPDGACFQFDACQTVPAPQPGDLGFLWSDKRGMIGHVMVATEAGTVVHAVGGRGVVEEDWTSWEANPRWRGWRRHVDFARPPEDRS